MSFDLIVFDFDGVLVDSETLANQVLADELSALGCPTTLDDAFDHYMGYHWDDCLARIAARWGGVPADLRARVDAAIEARVATELRLVDGVERFLDRLGDRPCCVASSSHPDWLSGRLALFGLADRFADRLFSAAVHVARGKPAPDIYLHAAAAMDAAPSRTLVIEDSAVGVTAGVAAGMTVVGLLAGTHVRDGHGERLRAAGAHHLARSYDEVADLMQRSAAA
jgi:HAD superfamily hydrolase (TIGR01509 family)